MNPHNQEPKPTPISWGKKIHGYWNAKAYVVFIRLRG